MIIAPMKAVRTSETSVYFNKTIWRNIPEGSNLLRTERLKSVNMCVKSCKIHCHVQILYLHGVDVGFRCVNLCKYA
jgi:hypothetical protein